MNKSKRAATKDALKWLDKPPTVSLIRDVEDACATYYVTRGLNPRTPKRNDVKFTHLLPHLKLLDKRWTRLRTEADCDNKRVCLKALWQVFSRMKSNPAKLQQMMDNQATDSEPSHDAGINGDYGAEEGGDSPGSDEDERDADPEDDGDDRPEDGGSVSSGSRAPKLVARAPTEPSPVPDQLLGKRGRDLDWTEADDATWINFGKACKRMNLAQKEITAGFRELNQLCKGLPVNPSLINPENMLHQMGADHDSE